MSLKGKGSHFSPLYSQAKTFMYLLIIYSTLKIGKQMRTLVFMNTVNYVDKTSVKGQIQNP